MRVRALGLILFLTAVPLAGQHDITKVEPATPDSAIATPIPEKQKGISKYDIPELAGARQALGSQLIDGRLPRPLIDFVTVEAQLTQRVSLFEGGLVVVEMTGPATIRKKVLIPDDALAAYRRAISPASLRKVEPRMLVPPEPRRRSTLRVYLDDGSWVERTFHPARVLPKQLSDQLAPLRDLLRAISEDRSVTSSVAGYEPKVGDHLVADDQKVYRVERIVGEAEVVELRCVDAPATIYVAKRDLHLYFIGAKPQ